MKQRKKQEKKLGNEKVKKREKKENKNKEQAK